MPEAGRRLSTIPQLRFETVFSSELVEVNRVCCRPNERGCGTPEAAAAHHVVLPHRGVFVKHVGRSRVVAHPATVLFFTAGREYRVSHPAGDGDDCTSLRFDPDVLYETLARVRQGAAVRCDTPFDQIGAAVAPPTGKLLASRRFRTLATGAASALEVEETALDLLRIALAPPANGATRSTRRADSDERARRWAHDVELSLAMHPGRRWTLAGLGREVGSSPYHLARRFRAVTGSSIHRRLLAIRLAVAAERVLGGDDDLSGLAIELGFASHAHLSTAFRREYGVPPSALRRNWLPPPRSAVTVLR